MSTGPTPNVKHAAFGMFNPLLLYGRPGGEVRKIESGGRTRGDVPIISFDNLKGGFPPPVVGE